MPRQQHLTHLSLRRPPSPARASRAPTAKSPHASSSTCPILRSLRPLRALCAPYATASASLACCPSKTQPLARSTPSTIFSHSSTSISCARCASRSITTCSSSPAPSSTACARSTAMARPSPSAPALSRPTACTPPSTPTLLCRPRWSPTPIAPTSPPSPRAAAPRSTVWRCWSPTSRTRTITTRALSSSAASRASTPAPTVPRS